MIAEYYDPIDARFTSWESFFIPKLQPKHESQWDWAIDMLIDRLENTERMIAEGYFPPWGREPDNDKQLL